MFILKTGRLFVLTAATEIIGCYLPYLLAAQRRFRLAAAARGHQPGTVCLAIAPAPHRRRRVRYSDQLFRILSGTGCPTCLDLLGLANMT